jgi:uncharacterized short protein YbdD (DUF466 family)
MQPRTDAVTRRHDGTAHEAGGPATCRRTVVHRFFHVVRQLFGAPDYAAYLDHCRSAGHPALLTEREYVAEFFERKGHTARCC